ncbi:MAG: sulfur carrier protein ThiS [Pelagibacteraceae bacterium]|jgi:sulfur carrier protein|uniref:Thiamine biosynthesis protein ThiS n=1 Tax=marine metagenome TaxID=408172 RepID=A0A381RC97_9ZZZZ|nr:sulfur carrier protein ThiS [Pelagibacteraceae bacterium]MBO6481373.1 sulfur carrier protein ThiS [Pelagibacteraceae bacterium]MBO6482093.1 sulfur carrier protein ThiS [Pelagibacteraceae bacterium]MBO6483058.1 sulfur carrier protein ThiS [Pelagibacteraceae bacterium]MBO6485208.1 sulfur carrier protein ThiS [Pelagibacteraceae bacterium]|tara:strand:- start:547 stop:750 length:204 start_codon:yes stop_codon:yes gene_type:complete
MAKIQLNGKKVKIQRNLSIKDLIKKYRLKENKIAIELNGTILPKDHYKNKKVKNNDKIEIVQFIGGG